MTSKHLFFRLRKTLFWFLLTRGYSAILLVTFLYRRSLIRHKKTIMVTGSFGKTTSSRATRAVLGLKEDLWAELTPNHLGEVGWTLLRESPLYPYAVVEAGISTPGKMKLYASVVKPDIVVVTCIGSEHLNSFINHEGIREEKANALRALSKHGTAILNADDPHVRWMSTQTKASIVWFGIDTPCDIFASDISLDWPHGTSFTLNVFGACHPVSTRLVGREAVYPLLAAIAVGVTYKKPIKDILDGIKSLSPTRGRLTPIRLSNGAYLLADEYKATPDVVHVALNLLSEISSRKKWVVIEDLNDLPSTTEKELIYNRIGMHIASVADQVLIVGNHFKDYLPGLVQSNFPQKCIHHRLTIPETTHFLKTQLQEGDVVLIKGEGQGLRKITLALQGHPIKCRATTCKLPEQFCDNCPLL